MFCVWPIATIQVLLKCSQKYAHKSMGNAHCIALFLTLTLEHFPTGRLALAGIAAQYAGGRTCCTPCSLFPSEGQAFHSTPARHRWTSAEMCPHNPGKGHRLQGVLRHNPIRLRYWTSLRTSICGLSFLISVVRHVCVHLQLSQRAGQLAMLEKIWGWDASAHTWFPATADTGFPSPVALQDM